jgi:hypothetical protein
LVGRGDERRGRENMKGVLGGVGGGGGLGGTGWSWLGIGTGGGHLWVR